MNQKGVGSRMGWTAHCTCRGELYIHCWVGICEIIITLINAGLRFSVGHIDFGFSKQEAVGRVCVCLWLYTCTMIFMSRTQNDVKVTKAGKTFPDNIDNIVNLQQQWHMFTSILLLETQRDNTIHNIICNCRRIEWCERDELIAL